MKRSKHSLSHYKLLTADMGKLYPITWFEVLPGDTVQQATSLLLRVSPLLAPVMHPVTVRVHHFYVPYRILWDGWEKFITGGSDGLGDGVGSPPTVTISAPPAQLEKGSLGDYLGLPLQVGADIEVNAFPIKAYAKIYNEYYRDQDLIPEYDPTMDWYTAAGLRRIAWEKDYFSSARPWPQKGPDVSLPLGVTAPVVSTGDGVPQFNTPGNGVVALNAFNGQPFAHLGTNMTVTGTMNWANTKLQADLTNATAVNVNDVRRAFALQRWEEARAQYGSRFTEYLRYAFGVRSSDARLQRPEYLGGGKQTISFSEVLRTGSESGANSIGEMFGHGISALRSRRYRRFFEEHGLVMSLLSVRPRTIYTQGLHRSWTKPTKEDYFQRELELIGQQEVFNREVYGAHTLPNDVFGYQDRYSDYRHMPSSVAGDFRDTLDFWHLARQFATDTVLNKAFIECDPSKRINADTTSNNLWVMANHSIQARRVVGKKTIGRIL